MSLKDWIKGRVAALDAVARPWAAKSRLNAFAFEFLMFGLKQAWACLFGGAMLALLVGTHFLYPHDAPIARYDFLVVAAVALQVLLLTLKLEHADEAVVILAFHVVGTLMELFLAILQNGLILLSVPTSVGFAIKGIALIAAASLDRATLKAMRLVKSR